MMSMKAIFFDDSFWMLGIIWGHFGPAPLCYQLISTGCTTHGVRVPLKLGLYDGTALIVI